MAAKALTELSSISNYSLSKEKSKSIKAPLITQNPSEENLKQKCYSTLPEHPNFNSGNKEISIKIDNKLEIGHNFQQQLETAAVLMDISKKVIISPPCSNSQSPRPCSSIDSSIFNSVIRDKRPVNDNLDFEMDLSIKDSRSDLRKLIEFYAHQDKSTPTQEVYLNPQTCNNNKILETKVDTNAFNVLQTNTHSFPNVKFSNIETEIRNDRKTPDSITSEEHGTDAATTQLWQALARSAGKK